MRVGPAVSLVPIVGWGHVLSNSGFRDSPDGAGNYFKQLLTQCILGMGEVAEIFETMPFWGYSHLPSQLRGLQVPHPPDTWEAH